MFLMRFDSEATHLCLRHFGLCLVLSPGADIRRLGQGDSPYAIASSTDVTSSDSASKAESFPKTPSRRRSYGSDGGVSWL